MKYTAYIRNNETGEVVQQENIVDPEVDPEYEATQKFWWSRQNGNGGCDCNRGDFWHGDGEDHDYPCGETLFSVPYLIWEDGTKTLIDDERGGHNPRAHHIWCNFFMSGPTEQCNMCKRLRAEYPEDGLTPDELQEKHFPNAIRRLKR
jgi:hypothetical protein